MKTAFDYVASTTSINARASNFLAKDYTKITFCGLNIYNATDCPWNAAPAMQTVRIDTPSTKAYYQSVTDADIPFNSVPTILNESSPLSFLNELSGFPNWIAVGVYIGPIDFPFNKSSAMITDDELQNLYNTMRNNIAKISFGDNPTASQLLGTRLLLHVITYHIQTFWIANYATQAKQLVYNEWKSSSDAVVCSILGHRCVWQWGAVTHQSGFSMQDYIIHKLIDRATKVNTNPASLYYDGNSAPIYDSYLYCQQVLLPNIEPNECMDIDFAKQSATVTFPAGLASVIDNIDQINSTLISVNFAKKSASQKQSLIYLGCNISYLMHSVYRNSTGFHDEYVIRYLNKYKYPTYSHNFTSDNWEELGYSQWAGGYVTYALESVFSTYNLVRDGMWHIGNANYYRTIPEFFSWSILNGHPYLRVSNITEAKLLLDSLARNDEVGVQLRHHIMSRATTLIGDGSFQYTDTWKVGEYAYIPEYKKSNFSCTGELEPVCNLLKYSDQSSAAQCTFISDEIYAVCADRVKKRKNWVTNCNTFETAITNSIDGIACSRASLFGENHPVLSNRGLIVEKMMFSIVIDVIMKNNIWCPQYTGCQFQQSGLFITLSVDKLLFNGYTDASLVKYLSLKHAQHNISFECVGNTYDTCGNKNYFCSKEGIRIKLRNEELIFNSNSLPHSQYHAERLYVYNSSSFLWPHDVNETIANESQRLINSYPDQITTMINPYYALFPAWDNSSSIDFLKHYQCQGRYLFGKPNLYNSCVTKINTGKKNITKISNVIEYLGNDTIYQFDVGMPVNGTIDEQLQPGLWNAFRIYPYSYRTNRKGEDFFFYSNPVLWNRIHRLRLELTQSEIETWDKLQRVFPAWRTAFDTNQTLSYYILTRRFQEDYSSWKPYESTSPKDSYGMNYTIPVAMSSVERLAGYPIYIGTPHNYGNQLWGGAEFLQIAGMNPVQQEHRSYIDYDPVTGKILRRAFRQQVENEFHHYFSYFCSLIFVLNDLLYFKSYFQVKVDVSHQQNRLLWGQDMDVLRIFHYFGLKIVV